MLRLIAKIIYVLPIAAIGFYTTTGVGLLGAKAMATNHALTSRALDSFMNLGERYFQAHPIYQPSMPPPPASPAQVQSVDKH